MPLFRYEVHEHLRQRGVPHLLLKLAGRLGITKSRSSDATTMAGETGRIKSVAPASYGYRWGRQRSGPDGGSS